MKRRDKTIAWTALALLCAIAFMIWSPLSRKRATEHINPTGVESSPSKRSSAATTGAATSAASANTIPRRTPSTLPRGELRQVSTAPAADSLTAHDRAIHLLRCKNAQSLEGRIEAAMRMEPGPDASAELKQNFELRLQSLKTEVTYASNNCRDTNFHDGPEQLYSALREAAMSGDQIAANCLLDGLSIAPAESAQKQIDDFRSYAGALIDRGIESGNWATVELLILAYGGTDNTSSEAPWLKHIVQPDALAEYAYRLLERLGTEDSEKQRLMDSGLTQLENANNLSISEVEQAKQWASAIRHRYFSAKPFPAGKSITICDPKLSD